MKRVLWFIHEWRTGWNQGVINRAEARLAAMGEEPHRPGDCALTHQTARRPSRS